MRETIDEGSNKRHGQHKQNQETPRSKQDQQKTRRNSQEKTTKGTEMRNLLAQARGSIKGENLLKRDQIDTIITKKQQDSS